MHIVVCVKQVPDIHPAQIDPATYTLLRQQLPGKVDRGDLTALEVALSLRAGDDDCITLLTMGPPDAELVLTHCLTYGADRAILLTDPILAGSDSLATSYALSLAIWKISQATPVDLVLCALHSSDGHSAQIGPGIARHLGWQQVTAGIAIQQLDCATKVLVVERQLENGTQVVRTSLPAVVSIAAEACTVREASLPNVITAMRILLEVWSAEDIDADPALVGQRGSPTRVLSVTVPPARESNDLYFVEKMGLAASVAAVIPLLRLSGGMSAKVTLD